MTGREFRLRSPLGLSDVMSLQAGDTVFISGPAYEIKTPSQYIKILDAHNRTERLPFDLSHATIYHTFSSIGKAGGNWHLNYLNRYDFEEKKITEQTFELYRDMHCWEGRFTWVLQGYRQGYYFRINIKALPEVKIEKSRGGLREMLF